MVITEEERRVIASNKATDRMLDRIPVWMHGNTQFVSVAGQAIPISAYGGQVP
jgi:hypothetical protein